MRQEGKAIIDLPSRLNAPVARKNASGSVQPFSRLILIIDDQSYTSNITAHMLNRWGFATEVAHSPAAALRMLCSEEVIPDLILVEVSKLSKEVLKFPRAVHSMSLWKDIPIVAHSVRRESSMIMSAIKAGFGDYILRPTDPDILREKIEANFAKTSRIGESFFALPIVDHGSAAVDIRLTAINELGVEGFCAHPLVPGSVMRLSSDLIGKLRLELENFRVVHCEETKMNGSLRYKVAFAFVALSPRGARSIREHMIRSASRAKLARAA